MSDLTKDLEHVASEECQQDWADFRFKDVYRKAFIDGGRHVGSQAADLIEQQQKQIDMLTHKVDLIKHKVDIDARKEVILSIIGKPTESSLAEVRASAIEEAVELYTHKLDSTDEMNQVSIDIIKKGKGFIYPDGLLEHANKIRNGGKDGE